MHGGKIIARMTAACGTFDVCGITDFAVRACANAEIVAKLPVVEIMAGTLGGFLGKSTGFILGKTGSTQRLVYRIFNILRRVVFRQPFGRCVGKGGVGFQRELIGTDVLCALSL